MSQVELQIAKHAKSRRRGGPWDENALRSLLFSCWAQSAAVATGPIRVDGFSHQAILDKLRRLRQDPAMVSVLDLVALKWVVLSTAVDFLLALLVFGIGAPTS